MEWSDALITVLLGVISGLINTLASSGSAVSLPGLMELGLSPEAANATNRMGIILGAIAALFAFQRKNMIDWGAGGRLVVPMLVGAGLGAWAATAVPSGALIWVVNIALLAALIMVLSNPKRLLVKPEPPSPMPLRPVHYGVMVAIGFWTGLIVLDSATYLLLFFVLLLRYDLGPANALKALMLLVGGITSLLVFAGAGTVDWPLAIALGIGSIAGGYFGGLLASMAAARRWVGILLIAVLCFEVVHLTIKYWP